ncbi:HAD-like domain-containing protein [Xylaria palmicola]|nr:HAD-like domain-containing protein [Xylaria palmicola]
MSSSYPDLTGFKALSFDCYGTLIDWEGGMLSSLRPLVSELPEGHPLKTEPPMPALQRLEEIARSHEVRTPSMPYNELLVTAMSELARETGVSLSDGIIEPFGNAVGTWRAFPDTVAGLRKLAAHYRLILLSNVDNANIAATVGKQLSPARLDAVYTAQDIGSYKPAHANFHYLFAHARDEFGVDWKRGDLLHVAHSLRVDHVPAKELGLRSVWIARGADKEGGEGICGRPGDFKDTTAYEWKFDTIGDFADEVERQFAAKKS